MEKDLFARIPHCVFQAVKRSIPQARLLSRGSGHNGHRDFAINDRTIGDVITFRVKKLEGDRFQCEILKIDLSKLPPVHRITSIRKTLEAYVEKRNETGW